LQETPLFSGEYGEKRKNSCLSDLEGVDRLSRESETLDGDAGEKEMRGF